MDHDVSAVNERFGGGSERLAALLGQRRQVQASSAEEILGLSNVHPEALKVERVELVIADHGGEGLLLDRGGAELDAIEDGGVENVQAGVDAVSDELNRLLDESIDAGRVASLVNDDSILGGLLDLGDDDGALIAVALVEREKVLEGVIADDVRVQDEEGRVVLGEDLLGKLQGTGSVERFGLDGELNVDVVLLLILNTASVHGSQGSNIPQRLLPLPGTSP